MTIYTKPPVKSVWAQTGDTDEPSDASVKAGYPSGPTPPNRQQTNWLLNYIANAVRYFMQRGISAWDAGEDYPQYARVQGSDGHWYKSVIANNGNDPTTDDGTNWLPHYEGMAEATTGEAAAMTSHTVVMTPARVPVCFDAAGLQLFETSGDGCGFQILPGGLILQWMRETSLAAHTTSTQTFVFPVEFPNAVLNIQTLPQFFAGDAGTPYAIDYIQISASSKSQVVFTYTTNRYVFAIGY